MIRCPHCGHSFGTAALTVAQKRLLDFIRKYRAIHEVPPTFAEMMQGVGLASKSGIFRLVNGLQERGAVQYSRYRPRSIVVLEDRL